MRRQVKQRGNICESGTSKNITFSLGETIDLLLTNLIDPKQKQFGAISNLWYQLMPPEICNHSKITDISNGLLKVMVDSPSYLYELRLCSKEILAEIHRRCPQARIREIKLAVG